MIGFTDHYSIVDMQQQVDISNTTSRTASNKKVLCALEYTSQFNIRLLHKAGKDPLIPDALSRPDATGAKHNEDATASLDNLPNIRPEDWLPADVRYASIILSRARDDLYIVRRKTYLPYVGPATQFL